MPGRNKGNGSPDRSRDSRPAQPQQHKVQRKKIRPIGAGKSFALGLLAALIVSSLMVGVIIFYSHMRDARNNESTEQAILNQNQYVNDAISNLPLTATAKTREAVMSTAANITVTYPQDSQKANQKTDGAGVVFKMSPDGNSAYVLTSYHVIADAADFVVTIQDVSYKAQPVGAGDPSSDVAVLRIDNIGSTLPTIDMSRTDEVTPGEWCMAVGNPHGFNNTMSIGTISAVHRNIPRLAAYPDVLYANMIQTDASLNPGNSGGGIWDAQGHFLGMVSLIWTSTGGDEGIGFAVPARYALTIAEDLVNGKKPAHASIGANLDVVPNDVVAAYGLSSTDGAYVMSVKNAGAAERGQITQGDIIVKIDGRPIKNPDDVILTVRGHAINDQISVTVSRQGKEMEKTLTLGSDEGDN